MTLDKAIETYNELHDNEIVKKFNEANSIVINEILKQKPKKTYYKSSVKFDYYIEEPYEKLEITANGISIRKCGFNGIGTGIGGNNRWLNFCLSFCNYSKEKIIEIIEKHIRKDNEEND